MNRVVKTCLAKDPEDRFQTAHDAKLQLEWIAEGGSQAGLPAPVVARRKNREKLAWAVAAVGILAAAVATLGYVRRAPTPPLTARFDIAPPEDLTSIDTPRVSPDGRLIAFNATDSAGKTRIWMRPLNALSARALEGTDGTTRPFWSPDSKFLAFFAEGKLKKVDIAGGPPTKICDAPSGADGSWSSEGVILFDGVTGDPIQRVSAAGGTPVVEVKPDPSRKETQVAWPAFLPDGKHFLYTAVGQKTEDSMFRIGSLGSSESRPVAPAQTLITYAPPGYLLFVRDKTLVAQRFDLKSLKTIGEPAPIAEKIGTDSVGLARFSVSRQRRPCLPQRRFGDPAPVARPRREGARDGRRDRRLRKSGALPTGRPAGVQRVGRAHRKARRLGPRPRSRRQLPIHVWRGRADTSPRCGRPTDRRSSSRRKPATPRA